MSKCDLCTREVITLTKHHLKPKSRGGSKGDTIMVCLSCREMIHRLIPNKELDKKYNSLEMLLSHLKIQKYVKWVVNQKKERITIATKKKK